MSMVEDLIKSLRICGRTGESCDGCMFSETDPDECGYRLNAAAAAALENAEELNKWLNESNNKLHGCLMSARTKLAELCGTQGWIRPEDQLPPTNVAILICRQKELGVPMVEQARFEGDLGGKLPWKVYGTRCAHVDWWMPMPEPPEVEA